MSEPTPELQRGTAPPLPSMGCWFLGVPPLAIIATGVAYIWLVSRGLLGIAATGPVTELVFDSCPEARPVLEARLEQMGLPVQSFAPTDGGFKLVVTMPADPDAAGSVPAALTMGGKFWVATAPDPLLPPLIGQDQIETGGVRFDLSINPRTFVKLNRDGAIALKTWQEAHPYDQIHFFLDGVRVGGSTNLPSTPDGELEFSPQTAKDAKDEMHVAASRGVALATKPLPCPVSLRSSAPAR